MQLHHRRRSWLHAGDVSNFVDTGGHFVVGGGVNAGKRIGLDAEFMWYDLPPKSSVIALTGAPDGSARLYSVTGNFNGPYK